MELVVDSNYLNDSDLVVYLEGSNNNKVVLTDFALMEATKSVDLEMFKKRIYVLSQYPEQVIFLKSTRVICGMSGRAKRLNRRLLDTRSNENLIQFFKMIAGNSPTDKYNQKAFMENAIETKQYFDALIINSTEFIGVFRDLETQFTSHELLQIRKNEDLTLETIKKLFSMISLIAGRVYEKHPHAGKWPIDNEWPNTFIYRNTCFQVLYFFEWMKKGSPKNVKKEKIRNDIVDLNFCTYATYFDGLLTKDKRCLTMYIKGNDMLNNILVPALKAGK